MLRSFSSRFGWILLILGLWSVAAQAEQLRPEEQFRYRYVSLDQLLPSEFRYFESAGINDFGRVYGTAFNSDFENPHIAVYADGAVKILQSGFATTANISGTVGGYVLYDPENYYTQAALFRGDKVELIPFGTDEISSVVIGLNDMDFALVSSFNSDYAQTYSLYLNGQALLLDIDPDVYPDFFNNQGFIAGTTSGYKNGFRLNPFTGELTLLNPVAPDPYVWAQGMNSRGDVLGYSFVWGALERIGVWDSKGIFRTYFSEGIPEFPTISNHLVFNDRNQIVITSVSSPRDERGNSYLVPKPGVRLNLASLVEDMPLGNRLNYIGDINIQGSMIGVSYSNYDHFVLERIWF